MKLTLSSSRYISIYLISIHSIMMVTILFLSLPTVYQGILCGVTLLSSAYHLRNGTLLKGTQFSSIEHLGDQSWCVVSIDGNRYDNLQLTRSFVSENLVILYLQNTINKHLSIPILSDMISAEEMRKLRLKLRNFKSLE